MAYYVGLDLGQSHDFTAIAVIERVTEPPREVGQRVSLKRVEPVYAPPTPPAYACVHLARCPLGTPYPRVVEQVRGMLATTALKGASLIVDGTGVGAPVVDMLRLAGLRPIPVIITGGDSVGEEENRWRVPKRDLAATLQVLLQSRRLKVAQSLPDARVLAAELENFQVKVTAAANETFGAWREGQHDDLVLAVALACWWAERNPPRESMSWLHADDDDEPRPRDRDPFHEALRGYRG